MGRSIKLLLLAGFLACIGLGLLFFGMRKTITLVVDGKAQTIDTWAWRVEQVLQAARIARGSHDLLYPPALATLADGDMVKLEHASTIQIAADGKNYFVYAANPIPANVTSQAGLQLFPGDELTSAGIFLPYDVPLQGQPQTYFWQLRRAIAFTISDGIKQYQFYSTAATVGQAVWQAGIHLLSADRLTPAAEELLTPGMTVEIERAKPVVIQTALGELSFLSAEKSVGDILLDSGLSLQGLDYTIPGEGDLVPRDGKIRLVRVREEILIQQTPVPFETSFQPVADLEIDHQNILESGQYGIFAERVRIRYEDGQEVSRQVEDQWQAQAPVSRLVGYGTQIVMHSIQTADGTVEYWRALEVYATSYKPSDTGSNITATGKILQKGIIGVNPHYIPYGTVLYVEGYGYGVAADTGNIGPRWIDLGYTDEDFVGWHRNVTVYFVWPPPEKIVWIIP